MDNSDWDDDIPLAVLSHINDLDQSLRHSRMEHDHNQQEWQAHEKKLDRLLKCNGRYKVSTKRDGDCFFSSIIKLNGDMAVLDLRDNIGNHMIENIELYKPFTMCSTEDIVIQATTMKQSGTWNAGICDLIPLACCNVLDVRLTIFKSDMKVSDVYPVHDRYQSTMTLAYFAISGKEHYEPVFSVAPDIPSYKKTSLLGIARHDQARAELPKKSSNSH